MLEHTPTCWREHLACAVAKVSELQAEMNHGERINDRCPSCRGTGLFIGSGGWLTCSYLECKDPVLSRAIDARIAAARREGVAEAIVALGLSTGHGDTAEDMIAEARAHLRDLAHLARVDIAAAVAAETERCRKAICDGCRDGLTLLGTGEHLPWNLGSKTVCAAAAIRARREGA